MTFNDAFGGMTVRETMTREVFAVARETTLDAVAALFAKRHISGAPVVDKAGRPLGVVTLSDLLCPNPNRPPEDEKAFFYRITDHRVVPLGVRGGTVADVMSHFILSVGPESPLGEAIRLMASDAVHRLLVIDGGNLVGIISSMDVLRALTLLQADHAA